MEESLYFYNYSFISAIALVVHLIISGKQLLWWRLERTRKGVREFGMFLAVLSCFFISDIVWGVLAEWKSLTPLYIDTILFFVLLASTILFWTRFVVAYLGMKGWQGKSLTWAGRIIWVTFVISMIINHFTGSFFKVDETSVYSVGLLRHLQLAILSFFNIYSTSLTSFEFFRTKGAERRRNFMVVAFCGTMLATVLLQFEHPLMPFYSLGYLIGCCLLHVFVFEDERDENYKKRMQAHEYAAKLEAERAANRAKSLFFSSVSHDIRTPLNAIIGFSELLEQDLPDEKDRKRFVSSIKSSAKVLARLLDDVLDLSKLEIGKLEIIPEPTDMAALVREVIDACEVARSRKSLALTTEIADIPCVMVDPHRVRQILFNLLSNACKYTQRGTITVRVRWDAGTLTFDIADTGEGISEENLERILQPFVQVVDRNHRNGTGLGLPICQKLARLMGGDLSIQSKLGVGSTFTVTLNNVKLADATPAESRPGRIDMSAPIDASPKLAHFLVVDDSPVNRAVLKALLNKCGVTNVDFAENGQVAYEMLVRDKFDIVLTDLWMPKMDGYALIRAIRDNPKFTKLPVYLITADVDVYNNNQASGFTAVLLKPITAKALQSLVKGCEG